MNRHSIYITLLSLIIGGPAFASPPQTRAPIQAMRSTQLQLTRFGRSQYVVRTRGQNKEAARFAADAQPIAENTVIAFEAYSQGKAGRSLRWRCVAVSNVSECFSTPLRVRYLPKDERVVLSVTPISVETSEGLALLNTRSRPAIAQRD